jgi:hypothetical protein
MLIGRNKRPKERGLERRKRFSSKAKKRGS